MTKSLRRLWKDRRGGPLQQALIWACVLGGFYYAWTHYLGPAFMGSAQKQSNVLKESSDTYLDDSVPTN